jgi:quinoprotein glucose dehydrogenase
MLKPANASGSLAAVLETGSLTEKQGALATLGKLADEPSDRLVAAWVDRLAAGKVAKELQFDVLQAASQHPAAVVQDALKKYQARQTPGDPLAGFRETLYGGDADAGRKVFLEKPEAACTRCHKINGTGGDVGPELAGIITRHDREYILESILYPNKQIAAGFESLLVKLKSGEVYAGIVKSEDQNVLVLNANDDGVYRLMKIKVADIQSRQRGQSAMPEGMGTVLPKQDLRNLVEFLATLKPQGL